MATIGVYDSGIGGLTTLKHLIQRFTGNDFYYLADNANLPFGSKSTEELTTIVNAGIAKLRKHADMIVLACNTASSLTQDDDVYKLLPPVCGACSDPQCKAYRAQNARSIQCKTPAAQNAEPSQSETYLTQNRVKCDTDRTQDADHDSYTLLLATPKTIDNLSGKFSCKSTQTKDLATLIEIQASLRHARGDLDMSELMPYLYEKLSPFKGVKNVALGCSHYLYCKPQIRQILGDVTFCDGNNALIRELSKTVSSNSRAISKIEFAFTSTDESRKYENILKLLVNTNVDI